MVDLAYQSSVQPEPFPGRAIPRLPDEANPQAFGVGVGRSIEQASDVIQQMTDRVQAQARQTQLTDAHNKLQSLSMDLSHNPQTGAFTKQGQDAFNLNSQYLPQYDQGAQKIIDAIPDSKVRALATGAAGQVRNQLGEQLDSHEITQHQAFNASTAQASIKLSAQTAAANYNHPDIIATNRDTMDASLENLAQQKGWSDEQLAEAKQEAHSSLHTDIVERMIGDSKVPMAKAYLQANKNEMDARQYEMLQANVNAKLKEQQNEQKQDIADRYQDSLKAAEYGLPKWQQVSRAEMNVLYPKDAQRRWDELNIMASAGAKGKQYDTMSAPEIIADLAASKPDEGGPEAVYHIQAYQALHRAAEQSIQQRTADPAQFVQSRGQWQPINFNDQQSAMQNLQSRANTQNEVSHQIGVPVPLLSKPEARQFSSMLDNSDPKARVSMLSALHDGMGNEQAYFSMLHEIAPNSPVTAIVGANMSRPTPANTPSWHNAAFDYNPMDAEKVLTGEALLNPKSVGDKGGEPKSKINMPLPTSMRQQFSSLTGDLFRDRAELGEDHYQAFLDAYAALSSEKGDTKGVLNTDMAKQAAKMAVGNTTTFNNKTVAVPNGMDPTMFESAVNKAVASMAQTSGAPPNWAERIRGFGINEIGAVGSGKYQLVQGNAPLVRPDGKPFTIDLKQQYINK